MDTELKFNLQSDTTGQELFTQVVNQLHIRETWFFGLQYVDSKDVVCWVKMEKKVLAHDIRKASPEQLVFQFRVRFYPEDVSEELIEDVTQVNSSSSSSSSRSPLSSLQKLFFLQVKDLILNDKIYCPTETCVLLASFAVQAKFGDYDERTYQPGTVDSSRLLPRRAKEKYSLSEREWESRVVNWWKEQRGLLK